MKAKRSSHVIVTLSLAVLLICAMLFAGCTSSGTTKPAATQAPIGQKQTIKISGSTTVLPIVQKAADQYMALHPDADIQISGGGSGVGIQAIGDKIVDIGMTSREVTKDEMTKYPSFVVTTVAQDGIAVIVNPANTLPYINLDQVKNIYLGNITKWSEITGANMSGTNNQIVVIGRDRDTATLELIENGELAASYALNSYVEGFIALQWLHDYVNGDLKVIGDYIGGGINPLPKSVDSGSIVISKDNANQFKEKYVWEVTATN